MRTLRRLLFGSLGLALLVVSVPVGTTTPTAAETLDAVAVSAGGEASCLLTSTGGVQCWGERYYRGTSYVFTTPDWVKGLRSGVQDVATGWSHSCALTVGGAVRCWGWNDVGQIGDGTTKDRAEPVAVTGLGRGVVQISLNSDHSCAVTQAGDVKCWGENREGQLGDGTTKNRHAPVAVVGLRGRATSISTGPYATCAVLADGRVRCWGENSHGELGNGTTIDRVRPATVRGLPSSATSVTMGSDHACAVTRHDGVLCWGDNRRGQLGDGTTTASLTPTPVTGLTSGRTVIDAGDRFTCAVLPRGPVECWGGNGAGMLGDGTNVNHRTPTRVVGLGSDVVDLAVGGSHSCVTTGTGAARCWGENSGSQIGDGTYENCRYVPMTVWGFTGVLSHTYRPDLLIARHRDGPYRGDDVYSDSGEGQTRQFVAVRGKPATFFVRVQTDGDVRDIVFVEGKAWYRWQYPIVEPRYFRGGQDISRAIELGLFWKRIRVDGVPTIRVVVKAHPNLVPRRGESFKIWTLSSHDPTRSDVVKIKVLPPTD